MKVHLKHAAGLAGVVATALTWATASYAEGTTIVAQPPPAPVNQTTVAPGAYAEQVPGYTGPNRALIGTGLVTFALSYIPAVIVAGESRQPADRHLYIPVAGPWMDLANRPDCGPRGSVTCDTETTNKVLLAVSGVFQGLGVLTTLAGLFSTEHEGPQTVEAQTKPSVHVSPAQMGAGGYGLAAFGTF
jgi:hypothetical protein